MPQIEHSIGNHSISVLFRNVLDGVIWLCTGVYGPLDTRGKVEFLNELSTNRRRWDFSWLVSGDFNRIGHPWKDRAALCSQGK